MCAALLAKGTSVEVASTDAGLDHSSGLVLERLISYKGLPVILFPKQLADSFKYSRPFSRWLDENVTQYDLVHIHSVFNHSCIAAARACRKNGVPYIVRPLGTLDPWSMNQKSFRKRVFWHAGIQRMLEGASAIHYTATGEQEAVESSLNLKNGFVAPLGVDVGVRGSSNDAIGQAEGHSFVLVLSRLHPKKEFETLIEAFLAAVVKPGLEHWRLVIAGDGEADYVNRLREAARNDSTDSPVLFTGWLQGEKKEAALRNASLVALVSRQENFGLCIAEAMAHGVPVLVSPQVNLAEDIEQSGSGWVAPIDKEKLAEVLMDVMSDEDGRRARGRAGKELAQRRFTWDVIAQQLAQIYSSIIETRVVAADMRPQADSRHQRIAQG
jgi:glycosyltransferase involved in cell wall biosynthesis